MEYYHHNQTDWDSYLYYDPTWDYSLETILNKSTATNTTASAANDFACLNSFQFDHPNDLVFIPSPLTCYYHSSPTLHQQLPPPPPYPTDVKQVNKRGRKRKNPMDMKKKHISSNTHSGTRCTNCKTGITPLWRRNPQGQPLCNACGLFLKLHGTIRPLSLKTDIIKKRNRGSQKKKQPDTESVTSSLSDHALLEGGLHDHFGDLSLLY